MTGSEGDKSVIEIVDGRFELTPEVRTGGMAQVYKAHDRWSDGSYCAIKRMLPLADEFLAKESFQREFKALEMLQHKNIVRMITCGIEEDHRPYIAMEWVESDLAKYMEEHSGPMEWSEFWYQIGRPLLEALCLSQSRRWVHRDLKPKNILINAEGEPKLTDYGIARFCQNDSWLPNGRPTFRDHGSKPFTPPESDADAFTFTRDGFSWGVVALYCLTNRVPEDYGDIRSAIENLAAGPIEILLRACSLSPVTRPPTAAMLLQEIDEWEQSRSDRRSPQFTCWISFPHQTQTHLVNLFGPEVRDPVAALMADFSGTLRVRAAANDPSRIRILGDSWQIVAFRDPVRTGALVCERTLLLGSAEAERQKDGFAGISVALKLGVPTDSLKAAAEIDEIFAESQGAEQERAVIRGADRDRIIRVWQTYLRARSDFEGSRASALRYADRRVNDKQVILTMTDPIPPDLVGQDRLIRIGQRYVFLEVTSALADEVTLDATNGDPKLTPSHGLLEVNTVRADLAIDRQKQALDAVSYGRSVNPFLRDVILDGRAAIAPLPNAPINKPPSDFDDDKVAVLRKAIGVQDVLAIEGPPGTGKTRLIEEIITQYLVFNPRHRVLLSSQTHAALDNVIERLAKRNLELDIVRVGRFGDARIKESAAKLLLERKAETWAERVAIHARAWLTNQAGALGVEPRDLRAGMAALQLSGVLRDIAATKSRLAAADARAKEASLAAAEKFVKNAVPPDSTSRREEQAALDIVNEAAGRLASLQVEEKAFRNKLLSLDGLGPELGQSEIISDLEEFAALLLGSSDAHKKCLALLQLQESWLERVGRSIDFHSAMLASANVVAATCIGLAGVRGINDVAFDLCIVDEASRATATEVLVPLSRSRRSILVGDQKQLPPFFEHGLLSSRSLAGYSEEELRENVFDRLLSILPQSSRAKLTHQYRMAAPIGNLVSEVFYSGGLISPKKVPEISFTMFPKAVTWLDTGNMDGVTEERSGTSWQNLREASAVRQIIESLAFVASKRKNAHYSVAVIAGYQAQVTALDATIRDQLIAWPQLSVRIDTVDAFQGSEADVCIYSVVRTNDRGEMGFLKDWPRLNVALSRARSLLLIVGDHNFCQALPSAQPMADVVAYIDHHSDTCEVRPFNDA